VGKSISGVIVPAGKSAPISANCVANEDVSGVVPEDDPQAVSKDATQRAPIGFEMKLKIGFPLNNINIKYSY
jgi:hypothetical protein